MQPDAQQLQNLLDEFRDGSQDAAKQIVEQYGPLVIEEVRRRVTPSSRKLCESNDFVQGMWLSFFSLGGRLAQIRSPEHLINYLVEIAYCNIIDETRRRMRSAEHVDRAAHLESEATVRRAARRDYRIDTPSAYAMAHEMWGHLTKGEVERNKRILELRLQNHTQREIAEAVGTSEANVGRILKQVKHRAKR